MVPFWNFFSIHRTDVKCAKRVKINDINILNPNLELDFNVELTRKNIVGKIRVVEKCIASG